MSLVVPAWDERLVGCTGWSVQVAPYHTLICLGRCHLVLYSLLQLDLKARRHMLTQDVWAQTTAAVLATMQTPSTRTPVSTFSGGVCVERLMGAAFTF